MSRYLFILTLAWLSTTLWAESSVWKVEKNESVVFIGGTIHMLRAQDYPLPVEYDQAFAKADIVTFETDIHQLQSPLMMQKLIASLSYSDQRTIASVVSAQTYQALEQHASQNGVSLNLYRKAKPGMLMTTLLAVELQKMGATAEGIDIHYLKRAIANGKQTQFLETPEQQIAFLARMGVGNEDDFYRHMLRDFSQLAQQMTDMLAVWRTGEGEKLNQLANVPLARDYPEMFQFLLVERNANWMPTVEAYFATPAVEFVLVGAAHLVGEEGLIAQLRAKGYRVKKL